MSYCSNCGARIKDNGICPNCGSVSESKIQPEQKNSAEVLICLRSFFSARPLAAVENAALTKSSPIWVFFGVFFIISCVASSLRILTSFDGDVQAVWLSDKSANVIATLNSETSSQMMSVFVSLIGYFLSISLLFFFIAVCITLILFLFASEKPSLSQAMNISAVSLFPLSLGMLVSIGVSFISIPLAIFITAVCALMSSISYYFGVQKVSSFAKSPFWAYFIAILVGGIILMVSSSALFNLLF